MISNRILHGNNIDTLKTLPDQSVNCCITSPPYYGLRDYGTAKWVGGDPECNHFRDNKVVDAATFSSDTFAKGDSIFKAVCKKCGAIREDRQIGLEDTPEEYIEKLVQVFREVRRILRDEGTLWVNIGDSYCSPTTGSNKQENSTLGGGKSTQIESCKRPNKKPHGDIKAKDLIGIPWMLAFALRADGWYLRQDCIWNKPNPMPESVTDRCTKSHEYIFLLSKSARYYFNGEAISEPAAESTIARINQDVAEQRGSYRQPDKTNGPMKAAAPRYGGKTDKSIGIYDYSLRRNKRSVWTVNTASFKDAHFAVFPEKLILPCILSGCPENGIVLDPFMGSGTTAVVALKNLRRYIGCEINHEYIQIAELRIAKEKGLFNE